MVADLFIDRMCSPHGFLLREELPMTTRIVDIFMAKAGGKCNPPIGLHMRELVSWTLRLTLDPPALLLRDLARDA